MSTVLGNPITVGSNQSIYIDATYPAGSVCTCSKGGKTLTAADTSGSYSFKIPSTGVWTLRSTGGGMTTEETITVPDHYNIALKYTSIYGAEWDGSSTTSWTRTDDAAGFADPVPAVNNGTGSSPFDACMPWSGMVKEERYAGVMVKIPKFWFKWTKSGSHLKLQIADGPVEGFTVSPAHQNRGDGHGERDYVYVGRYHCSYLDFRSITNMPVKKEITRSSARSSIHAIGSKIWQYDFAMWHTIFMLYLVEFADWNSQEKIGYGGGNSNYTQSTGSTDSMQYHTGTVWPSRTTYGVGVQYRWIEDLWGNVYDWLDGAYFNGYDLNLIKNPAGFSDNSGGTLVGTFAKGFPKVMSVANAPGFEYAIYPTTAEGSDSTYVPDYWTYSSNCLRVGGDYGHSQNYGLFCVGSNGITSDPANVGCRIQELP